MTALTSIVHGGESLGTVRYLRRERFLLADGTFEDIPVLSGNMLRGMLRRTAADLWWEEVGRPALPMAVAHAIWSGGAMAKSTTDPLTAAKLQEVRLACPVVGLFGAAGGGRVVDGTVQVGKAIPVCAETVHVRPEGPMGPSIWDLTQIEYFSKVPHVSGAGDGEFTPMRFGVESFVAGSQFTWTVGSQWASPTENALLAEALAVFASDGQVGGMGASGMGRVRVDLVAPAGIETLPDWRAYLVRDEMALLKTLARLD